MSLLISVLTPDFVVHVSDAPRGALPRTLVLRRPGARGLITAMGADDAVEWLYEVAAPRTSDEPEQLCAALASEATARFGADPVLSFLCAGFGMSAEGRDVSFQYLVTNFEDPEAAVGGFTSTGKTMVPTPARPGEGGRGKAKAVYRVQVSTTAALSVAARREVEALPRLLRKGASEVASACARVVREACPGAGVLLVQLSAKGGVEAAVLDGGVVPYAPTSDDGLIRLTSAE